MKCRKVLLCIITALAFFAFSTSTIATTYYIDSVAGNDGNSGTSSGSAWQSITKVNATTFSPGDQILFKADSAWTGQLNPKGSGSAGNPIIIDMYGVGNKPLIDAAGAEGNGAFYLYNQQYWEVNNLELTNDDATEGDRRGVMIAAGNFGLVNHIYLKDLYIHDIKGTVGQDLSDKDTAGIAFFIEADDTVDTRFDDVLIEGCLVDNVANEGIVTRCRAGGTINVGDSNWQRRKFTNFRVRNNEISNITKNAMIMRIMDDTCVVEYNVCHDTAQAITGNTMYSIDALGLVFQYNEGYLNSSPGDIDGCMYDADLESPETVWQYSYSHDNRHGLFKFCTVQSDNDVIVRYNISQNDMGRLVSVRYGFTSAYIYNNVFYIPAHLSPTIIHEAMKKGTAQEYYFYNNIIYNLSPTAVYDWYQSVRHFDNNVFYGYHPTGEPNDPNKITLNPRFVAPGTGGIGIDTVDGYKLKPGSVCIDAGISIPNNGGLDYWGNVVPQNAAADVGAHEWDSPADLDGDSIIDYNDLIIICDNFLDDFPAADVAPAGAPDGIINFMDYTVVANDWDWPDYNAPTPNPMGWQSEPNVTGSGTITMTAQTASDDNGVQYYFANVTDPNHDSGWLIVNSYEDTDLLPETEYTYRVKACDNSQYYNETVDSNTASATTIAVVTIFADGFEDCFDNIDSNWTNGGAFCSVTSYEGAKSCKMDNTENVESLTSLTSTVGYNSIRVKYVRNLDDMSSGDQFVSEWYDGSSWNTMEDITNPAEFAGWTQVEFSLAATADNNSGFMIRFRVDNASGNFAYVDVVEILGIAD